tara:strand:+ start:713 stop:961 length:249 start_codon:yes stop_codon:yes gene_type:complete
MLLKAKISKGGKIIIPLLLRKKLNLKEGEDLLFTLQDNHIEVSSFRLALEKARATLHHYHPSSDSLVDKLIEERREDAQHDA